MARKKSFVQSSLCRRATLTIRLIPRTSDSRESPASRKSCEQGLKQLPRLKHDYLKKHILPVQGFSWGYILGFACSVLVRASKSKKVIQWGFCPVGNAWGGNGKVRHLYAQVGLTISKGTVACASQSLWMTVAVRARMSCTSLHSSRGLALRQHQLKGTWTLSRSLSWHLKTRTLFVNNVQTRCIVKTSGYTRGVYENRWFYLEEEKLGP